ncbi:MAG: class I SAM-dependent methyltransferase [Pseudomonadota bacterium]
MADRFFEDSKLAALYDPLVSASSRDDYDFYLPFIMAARRVLDVGCGTGVLLKEARAAGHAGDLVGIDPARGMIDIAAQDDSIDWRLGDLTLVDLDGGFDFVVMTGHAFQVLLTDDEISGLFARLAELLAPSGRFGFETRNPAVEPWRAWRPERVSEVQAPGGARITMRREILKPFDGDTLAFRHVFESSAWEGGPETSDSTLRFMTAEPIDRLLAAAGLALDARYGGFDRSPFTAGSPEIITIARRASGAG